VATPGELATAPPYDSTHTAEVVPASEQSISPVLLTETISFQKRKTDMPVYA